MPLRAVTLALLTLAIATIAACGSSSSSTTSSGGGTASTSTSTSTATSTATTATGAGTGSTTTAGNTVTFAMVIRGSTITPTDKLTAVQGQTINLSFTTDKDEEIHLHGFDYKFECKAGVPQSMSFAADRTGAFEIEIEDTSTHLGELDVNPS